VSGAGVGPERTLLPVPTPGDRDRDLRRGGGTAALDDAVSRAERAVDDRVGPLSAVGEQESFPLPYYVATTSDTRAFSDARAAEYGGGADADWNRAFMKALGEGLERYCAGVYRSTEFVTAPAATRSAPVEPGAFVRPDDAPTPGPDEPIQWVPGEALETGDAVSLPAAFVHYPPPADRLAPPITTGLGLGNSGAEALVAGLAETVERDATMLAWYSTFDPLELAVDDDGYAELQGRARAMGLETTALLVTQDVDVPVVAAAVHRDGEWPAFAAGSGASLDPVVAARSALSEALQNWTELRGMGERRAAAEQGAIGRYAGFPEEVQRFFDAAGPVPASSVGPADPPTGADALDALLERVADAGLSPYAARLTTRDVEALGFEAVRVLVPAAQPLFTDEPLFGERARTVPESLGFEPRLDRAYHPFP
jgi:ribosomal protein S12 methylthiotransferase accessory factor